jgi:probable F420-dependent oxidoreductase
MPLFGMITFATEYSMQPAEVARAIEEHGLDAFYVSEHTHIPTSKKSKYPGGTDYHKDFYYAYDPIVPLTAAAGVTRRIRLGTFIILIAQRDPIVTAKQFATLDRLSGGRVVVGCGAGWNAEQMSDHGVPFQRRWPAVREHITAMKELWKNEVAEFHGEFVNFEPSWMYPKPLQAGGPPVLIGSRSDKVFARILRYADGWCPLLRPGYDLARGVKMLRAAAAQAGRRYDDLQLKVSMIAPTPDNVKQALDLGCQEVETFVPSAGSEKALSVIDNFAELAAKFH